MFRKSILSYTKESYKNCGFLTWLFKCNNIASKVDNLTKKSLNNIFDKNDDWNTNEKIDQSNVAITDVFSQFKESDSQIWSE